MTWAAWRARARGARQQQRKHQALSDAYWGALDAPGDTWAPDYRRALARAQQDMADAAGEYAGRCDEVARQQLPAGTR